MRRGLASLMLLAGCDQLFRLKDIQPPPPDADPSTIDADIGMLIDAGACTGSTRAYGRSGPNGEGLFSICMTPSSGVLDLAGTLNASEDTRCLVVDQDTAGTSVCVLVAQTITINANLRVNGQRPLILLATETIRIAATLNVASNTAGAYKGAGSNWAGCGNTASGVTAAAGGCGGAGGSFGTSGGNGGAGAVDVVANAKPPAIVDRVRGGCGGGAGGTSSTAVGYAKPGVGGGAVYLIAGTSIELTATGAINASGGGGEGGGLSTERRGGGGGSGGGSGGLIGLDAPTIAIDPAARLMANGGGGGGGGGVGNGGNGDDPHINSVRTRALGGTADAYHGPGGYGAAINPATNGGNGFAGGGGGGGVGVIHLYGVTLPASPSDVSPPWQTN